MKIYIGADHAGFTYKKYLTTLLTDLGYRVIDLGNEVLRAQDDYPDFAKKVAQAVATTKNSMGILICDSGAGMAIAANRVKGIRAVCVYSVSLARHARTDNDANILCLGSEYTKKWQLKKIITTWLRTKPSIAKRHKRRIAKIN